MPKRKQYPASQRRWYLAHRVLTITRALLWQRRNKEQVNKKNRRWKLRNPLSVRAMTNARRRKLRNHRPANVCSAALLKIYKRAQELHQWFDVVVDHIIPLAKGGLHSPENLQIIYRVENLRKGTRLDYIPTVVFS